MHSFKHPRFLLPLIAAVLFVGALPVACRAEPATDQGNAAQAEKFQQRQALVNTMADSTLSILQDQKKPFAEREATLERGISNMVDIDWIARFVLGSAWRTATDEQREHYTKLYRAYLTKMYINNFAQNSKRKISNMKILGIKDSEEDRFTARTEVQFSTSERMHVDYLVSESKGHNKIIDIIVEGMSLLATHRAEFSEIAASQGVDGVIRKLEDRVKSPL